MVMFNFSRNLLKFAKYRIFIDNRGIKRWVAPTLRELQRRKDKMPKTVEQRSKFIEWNHSAELYAFGKRLDENFNSELLLQAFTHQSYISQEEMKQRDIGIDNPTINLQNNKELSQLGENTISEYIENFLSISLPYFPKEGLMAVKSYLMTDEILANVSTHLGSTDIILSSEYPVDKSTLSTTFKAVVGALLKSSGPERAYEFIRDFLLTQLNGIDVNDIWDIDRPIEMLSDLYSQRGQLEPRLIAETGKNTVLATFQVGIYCDKQIVAVGCGESISIAHEMAAREALKYIFQTGDNMKPFNYKLPINSINDYKISAPVH